MFLIWYFHFKFIKTEARSLPMQVACACGQGLTTPRFTEDKLDSKPIKPKTTDVKDDSQKEIGDESETEDDKAEEDKDTTKRSKTPTPPKVEVIDEPEDEWIDEPVDVDNTEEGDDFFVPFTGTPIVDVNTEREEDIVSTVTTTQDSLIEDNGSLKIRIKRKIM